MHTYIYTSHSTAENRAFSLLFMYIYICIHIYINIYIYICISYAPIGRQSENTIRVSVAVGAGGARAPPATALPGQVDTRYEPTGKGPLRHIMGPLRHGKGPLRYGKGNGEGATSHSTAACEAQGR